MADQWSKAAKDNTAIAASAKVPKDNKKDSSELPNSVDSAEFAESASSLTHALTHDLTHGPQVLDVQTDG